ncbi:hypothetical protein [Tenacibaculum sp. 190524A05c]|uniref:Uncharacterized protein n=1 Tax=Tenacibaculum platacis TaxID=3137852 RepID=A0ABP1ECT7_9FLAO
MKKVYLGVKIISLAVFGILGMLSLLMFPFLIGESDTETSILGFYYLAIFLISFSVLYFIVKNELKKG